ncbi:MAG: TSUP family transporter, partial [Desulfovibrio sp.]|uniref:TSUP family transporter n=1 Tax=Desulfovibrio sp. TaxID=885 RepID=UPI0025863E24
LPWLVGAGVTPLSAVALSMPYQAATALSGTVGNWSGGHVDFGLLPMLCLLEVAGFFGGVAVVRRIPAWLLRRIIGVVCCGLGVFLLVRQLMS